MPSTSDTSAVRFHMVMPSSRPLADLLGRLPGAVGVGADDAHPLALADPLADVEAAAVGLPAAEGRQAALGGVALRLTVPDDVHLRDRCRPRRVRIGRDDLLGLGDEGLRLGDSQVDAVPLGHRGLERVATAATVTEPAQVQGRTCAVVALGGCAVVHLVRLAAAPLAVEVLLQVRGRVDPLGARKGHTLHGGIPYV